MKDRPILFNAAMVRAVLDDSKTQTRRAVKPQPYEGGRSEHWSNSELPQFCPYGQPGDRLWVRENFCYADSLGQSLQDPRTIIYTSTHDGDRPRAAKPSIHMPRWASRITLEIVSVRVERLQDISEADAKAEGIATVMFRPDTGWPLCDGYMVGPDDGKTALKTSAVKAYRNLWEQINGPGSWDVNPWVWVIEFNRVMP